MKNIKLAIITILITVFSTGCSSWLDDIAPRNAIPQSALTDSDLEKLLNGLYATMESYVFTYWWADDLQGENFKGGPGGGAITDPCDMAPSFTNQTINIFSFWRSSFTTLNQVNFLLESYEAASNKESAFMKKMGGTAYYFRAFIYYRLASHYGNVPILRKRSNDIVPISPEADVWSFIEENLKSSIQLLPKNDSHWYASYEAANALAARVALFQNKMPDAANYANEVLKNSVFSLTGSSLDFSKNWSAESTSSEIVFAFVNNSRASSPLTFTTYVNDTDASWNYAPSDWCYNHLFSDDSSLSRKGDIRKNATFSAQDKNRVIKYPNGTYQLAPTSDYKSTPVIITRLSEMYLIKAEALGKTNGAATLVEFMKKRYTTVPTEMIIQSLSDKDYQTLILDERRREFFAEGMRWQDIKRTNRLELLETLNGRTHLMYYPIPQAEIDMAGTDAYPQNPGYAGAKENE